MTTVTCVIPTHNRDESAVAAVRSVLAQSYPATNIVLVDDTGRDPSREPIRALIDSANGSVEVRDASGAVSPGASWSRNRGATGAETKYLAFLDDDDRWDSSYLREMIAALEESGADMAISWGALQRGSYLRPNNWAAVDGLTARDVVADNPGVTGSNFLIRREKFERQDGFDPSLWVWNDLDFFVRFLLNGGTYITVKRDLVIQTVTGDEHLSSRSERRAKGIEAYALKHKALLNSRQRRKLRREAHIARLYQGQRALPRLKHAFGILANSDPSYLGGAFGRRLRREPGYN